MLIPWLGMLSLVGRDLPSWEWSLRLGMLSLVGNALPDWEWSPWLGVVSLVGNAFLGWEKKAPGRPDPCCSTLMGSGCFFLTLVV